MEVTADASHGLVGTPKHSGVPIGTAQPRSPGVRIGTAQAQERDGGPPDERAVRAPELVPQEESDTHMRDHEQQSEDVNMGYIGFLTPQVDDFASEMILMAVGSSGGRYGRETRAACRSIVLDIYSPPRATADLTRSKRYRHLAPGFAFDLTTVDPDDGMPWDFSQKGKRQKARRKLA